MLSRRFLPSIGLAGTYQLKDPFNHLLSPNVQYTCTSIESIDSFANRGEEVFAEVYENAGADETMFLADNEQDAYIISITSGDGDVVQFPSTALLKWPDTSGVPYRNVAMTAFLSALPESFDFDTLETELEEFILAKVGTKTKIAFTQVGSVLSVPRDTSDLIEQRRISLRSDPDSITAKLLQSEATVAALQDKLAQLEAHIVANP